jgi:membrane fusion protein (multidrug efflux system)
MLTARSTVERVSWMKVPKYYIVVLAAIGCGSPNNYVAPPPPEVTVASPVQQAVTEHLEFSGMTQPVETVEIRARVRGFLKERRFVEGSEVGKGDLLLVIDEEPFQIALEASRTRLKEAEAALEQATGSKAREVAQAQVNLSQSRVVLAQQEEKRVRSLFQKNVSPQAEMDKLSAELKAREAELESGKANFSEAEATYETKILACRAQLESAAIAVRSAELDLSYCRMTAPISGRISRSNVDVGNLIESTGATVLATIVRMEPIYAYATISEADLQRIPALRGMTVAADGSAMSGKLPLELGLASESDFPKSGEIDYMDPGLDPDTGTLRIRGVFPNADRSLLPGMFVRMRLAIAERADALLIPERALGTDQSGQYVLAVDAAGLVQYRSVKTGVAVGGMRVVDGEIAITDQVIVEGLLRARPGSKVVPKKAIEATPTAERSDAAQVAK